MLRKPFWGPAQPPQALLQEGAEHLRAWKAETPLNPTALETFNPRLSILFGPFYMLILPL